MANFARDRLDFGDEVEGWMACLASLLPSSSFFFVYSSFILAFFLLLILLWSVFNFWLCEGVLWPRELESKMREMVLLYHQDKIRKALNAILNLEARQ